MDERRVMQAQIEQLRGERDKARALSSISTTICARCDKDKWCPWREDGEGYICAGCLAAERDELKGCWLKEVEALEKKLALPRRDDTEIKDLKNRLKKCIQTRRDDTEIKDLKNRLKKLEAQVRKNTSEISMHHGRC